MVREEVVLPLMKQPERVIVTTPLLEDADLPQLLRPVPKVTVGDAGIAKLEGSVTVIEFPEKPFRLDAVLKPTVQVEETLASVEPGVNATVDTELAAATPTPTRGAATAPMMIAGNNARRALITKPTSFVFIFIAVVRSLLLIFIAVVRQPELQSVASRTPPDPKCDETTLRIPRRVVSLGRSQ